MLQYPVHNSPSLTAVIQYPVHNSLTLTSIWILIFFTNYVVIDITSLPLIWPKQFYHRFTRLQRAFHLSRYSAIPLTACKSNLYRHPLYLSVPQNDQHTCSWPLSYPMLLCFLSYLYVLWVLIDTLIYEYNWSIKYSVLARVVNFLTLLWRFLHQKYFVFITNFPNTPFCFNGGNCDFHVQHGNKCCAVVKRIFKYAGQSWAVVNRITEYGGRWWAVVNRILEHGGQWWAVVNRILEHGGQW
jgi:hypothetical protein